MYIFKDMTLGIFDSTVEQNSCLWESLEFLKKLIIRTIIKNKDMKREAE